MNSIQVRAIIGQIAIKGADYEVNVAEYHDSHRLFIQVVQEVGGEPQKGRKWALSEHMTTSEVLQTIFFAIKTFQEHELREAFTYRGHKIFDPHLDIDEMIRRSQNTSVREEQNA